MKVKSQVFRQIWLQAGTNGGTVVKVSFETKKEAMQFRAKMYAFIRPYKVDHTKDEELTAIRADTLEIALKEQNGKWLAIVRPEWMNEDLILIANQCGVTLGPWMEEHAAQVKLMRSYEALGGAGIVERMPAKPFVEFETEAGKKEREEEIKRSFENGMSVYGDD